LEKQISILNKHKSLKIIIGVALVLIFAYCTGYIAHLIYNLLFWCNLCSVVKQWVMQLMHITKN